ncbi:hypothetical protein [Streptomyces sp. NPDC093568]|uniref:hypothetical protein n=1 Tax=Streptomyces sp. NPDC093568 TaxID=3366041 RepID=UPI0038217A13
MFLDTLHDGLPTAGVADVDVVVVLQESAQAGTDQVFVVCDDHALGAVLARMETELAFPALLSRFRTIEFASDEALRPTMTSLSGYTRLPLLLGR